MAKQWFPAVNKAVFRCKDAVSSWFSAEIHVSGTAYFFNVTKRSFFAALTCLLALGGSFIGALMGAAKGQTTETGFFRGAVIGALAGAVTAIELLESMIDGESLPKVALFLSLLNGKAFTEWVIPAVLQAYQWQISTTETSHGEISSIYDFAGARGLPETCIKSLPECKIHDHDDEIERNKAVSCTICLQDFKEGETARELPVCSHVFHLGCIDAWLTGHGTCPICRAQVCKDCL